MSHASLFNHSKCHFLYKCGHLQVFSGVSSSIFYVAGKFIKSEKIMEITCKLQFGDLVLALLRPTTLFPVARSLVYRIAKSFHITVEKKIVEYFHLAAANCI